MHVPPKAMGKPVQMILLDPALVPPVVILSQDQNRELESTLAQLLLAALQPSGQPVTEGEKDVVEDYA
jgi:hypothetical protein